MRPRQQALPQDECSAWADIAIAGDEVVVTRSQISSFECEGVLPTSGEALDVEEAVGCGLWPGRTDEHMHRVDPSLNVDRGTRKDVTHSLFAFEDLSFEDKAQLFPSIKRGQDCD